MIGNIYTIESPDKKWRAEVSARLGANIILLQYENEHIFMPLKTKHQLAKDPFVIGSPILFPANRTYKGEFKFHAVKYTLPINDSLNVSNLHGLLYCQKFNVLEKNSQKIVLCYENVDDIYPFPFKIIVEYFLDNNGLKQCYSIENTGENDMPFTFALHTTFIEPESFMVPIELCHEKNEVHIPTGRYIELNEQEELYSSGSASKNLVISGYYKSCGNVARIGDIKYKVSNNFDHWVLYNGGGQSGFLCVEPQCGAVNGLNIRDGFKILRPKCCEVFVTEISKNI